jgi:hypothetical protein
MLRTSDVYTLRNNRLIPEDGGCRTLYRDELQLVIAYRPLASLPDVPLRISSRLQ